MGFDVVIGIVAGVVVVVEIARDLQLDVVHRTIVYLQNTIVLGSRFLGGLGEI